MPERTMSLWLMISASAGASLRVPIKKREAFIQSVQKRRLPGGPPEKVKTWGKSAQIRDQAGTARPTDDALSLRGAETAAHSLSQGIGTEKPTGYRKPGPVAANRSILMRFGASGPLSVYNQSNFKGFEGGCMLDR